MRASVAVGVAVLMMAVRGYAQAPAESAPGGLAQQIATMVAEPGVIRAHWGVEVEGLEGTPIFGFNAGQMFQPASNAKLFTTAAAMALLGRDRTFTTRLMAAGGEQSPGWVRELVLVGDGDPNLSERVVPYVSSTVRAKGAEAVPEQFRYLAELADQAVANGLKAVVGDVVGEDTLFPYEPYAQDWAIDDAVWGYGAPVSALSISDNQIKVTVTPGGVVGAAAKVTLDPAVAYYTVSSTVTTGGPKSVTSVHIERAPGTKMLRIFGTIDLGAAPEVEEIAIEDPAEYAALVMKQMLKARGVMVTGNGVAHHRPGQEARGLLDVAREPLREETVTAAYESRFQSRAPVCSPSAPQAAPRMLASHVSARVQEDVVVTNKVSQNLHAELLLHQLGAAVGSDGSAAQGARVVRQFLVNAGIDKEDFVFFDGSGLSGHDLVTPRAVARLLVYASGQPWFAQWKSSLPVGGVDGSLATRFTTAALKGHVFAKTGTLEEARALSGYLQCRSGRTVVFSILVGNRAPGSIADRDVMDRMVAAIWAAE